MKDMNQIVKEQLPNEPVDDKVSASESDSLAMEKLKVERFNEWIKQLNFPINHLTLEYINPTFGYGTFASKDLNQGEIYLSVPSQAWMDVDSAYRSPILKDFFKELYDKKRTIRIRRDPTVELLVHLMVEKFIQKEKSFWFPYLEMLPVTTSSRMGSPLFYEEIHLQLLQATDLFQSIDDYREKTKSMFTFVKTHFFEAFPQIFFFQKNIFFQDIFFFKWALAILDSRSIWWNGKRHLVPLLDMVNCFTLPKGSTIHATTTQQQEGEQVAITKTGWNFQKNTQIGEDYGQPNYIYLHYHGFVLDKNPHDCIHFRLSVKEPENVYIKQKLIEKLQQLQVSSWTTEMCLSVENHQPFEMKKFKFLANLIIIQDKQVDTYIEESGKEQEQEQEKEVIANTKLFLHQRIQRLSKELESASKKNLTQDKDFRVQMILRYISTQLKLLEEFEKHF
jgi:histone-lysine N-methyltransferase SETD3